eukprot:TRINITY_DN34289_c0_g2_i1.p1 TRINITY_DN34289_c0_g2~~TRINITY_DN34289_c0_g2_i1.p1  ORF type:complete len:347 (+),score=71.62 TRINITY_DN34289_c0_g2_i1:139-1041(+)
MALLHLLCRAGGTPHLGVMAAAAAGLSCTSDIDINALIVRQEDVDGPSHGARVVKVKVGRDPSEDAQRTNAIASSLCKRGDGRARLRLDANQAWSVEEACSFVDGLSEATLAVTEYIEEPVAIPKADAGPSAQGCVAAWETFVARTNGRIRLAADESLAEGSVSLEDLTLCEAPLAAIVLKPAIQGLEKTMELAAWAGCRGLRSVLSSSFESGIALSHFAILASAVSPPAWQQMSSETSSSHGIGTFTRLAEDVLMPPFADLVSQSGGSCQRGWRVDAVRCQQALDRTADALVAERSAGE